MPVVRQGRYTLVELIAEPAQRDLLRQVVDISIPPTLDASVGDALQYVLLHSGYRLCNTEETAPLYALPLPASHMHLGPLTLRDTLSTLAGPVWTLSVDEGNRQICFSRVPSLGPSTTESSRPGPTGSEAVIPGASVPAPTVPQPWEE